MVKNVLNAQNERIVILLFGTDRMFVSVSDKNYSRINNIKRPDSSVAS